jgi:O-Antigen ligase
LSAYHESGQAPRSALARRILRGAYFRNSTVAWIAAAVFLPVAVGVVLPQSPGFAAVLVLLLILLAVGALFDVLGIAVLLAAALPWLVVMSEVLPRLTITFVAGATAAAILLVAAPQNSGTHASLLLRIGIVLFAVPILFSLAREGLGAGATQAAKYAVFPMMALVITEATNRHDLAPLRAAAFWSSVTAIAVNLVLGATGTANVSYYNSGEILGLGSEHTLALLSGCVTAASLASSTSLAWSPVVAIGAIATVATGVRSTLPGLALAAVVRMFSARVRLRMMVLLAMAVVGIFASGAVNVLEARYHRAESLGEYRSFTAFGSGRGGIYSVALSAWWHSSPIEWVLGTGLRTIPKFEQQSLGDTFVGHSDVVQVGVELGIAGFIGLLLMWGVVFVRAQSKLPLFVLASFALFNGVLEYGGPLVIGLLLATGTTVRLERGRAETPAKIRPSGPSPTPATLRPRSRGSL